jgi:hypothetical protein
MKFPLTYRIHPIDFRRIVEKVGDVRRGLHRLWRMRSFTTSLSTERAEALSGCSRVV